MSIFLVWPVKKKRAIFVIVCTWLKKISRMMIFLKAGLFNCFFFHNILLKCLLLFYCHSNSMTCFSLSLSMDDVMVITLSICSSCPNFFSACQCPPCHRLWRYSIVLLCLSLVFLPVLLFFDGVIVIGDHLILLVIDDEHFLLSSPLSFTGRLSSVVCRWRHRLLDVY